MRRRIVSAVVAVMLGWVGLVTVVATAPASSAVATEPYTWKNVRIGGGGFVPAIVFSQAEPDLIYARTDIGGAYRWNQDDKSWTPLLDWVGWDRWGYNGVDSIAPDPVDPDRSEERRVGKERRPR